MEQRKRWIKKIAAGLAILLLAGAVSYVIRDVLAMQNPESALPVIEVEYNGRPLPQQHYLMDSYSWRFLFTTVEWNEPDRNTVESLEPAPVIPGAPLEIDFSFPCNSMQISRSYGDLNEFVPVTGNLQTPFSGGTYTYRIEAEWGTRGSVLYYIKVRV